MTTSISAHPERNTVTGECHAVWGGLDRERQISFDVHYMLNLKRKKKKKPDELVCGAGPDSQT